jgi:hypothetical protein
MKEITANKDLVARCGLYCGACGAYLKGRCPGCHENAKATWCKVRACCGEHGYATCADCKEFTNPNDCGKFNNVISKVIGVVFGSNRQACVLKIRELGADGYATFMTERRRQSLPRRGA